MLVQFWLFLVGLQFARCVSVEEKYNLRFSSNLSPYYGELPKLNDDWQASGKKKFSIQASTDDFMEPEYPSVSPTFETTLSPSNSPSVVPSVSPSFAPTVSPTVSPSLKPSTFPTMAPSAMPSIIPSTAPSAIPSFYPTIAPSKFPTSPPSSPPSLQPPVIPSVSPSIEPSAVPSVSPTAAPSAVPTQSPSLTPTVSPSIFPSVVPTVTPSAQPTLFPTFGTPPSIAPVLSSDPIEAVTTFSVQQTISGVSFDAYSLSADSYLLAIRWAVAQTMTGCSAEDVTIISIVASSRGATRRRTLRRVLVDSMDGLLVDYTVRVYAQIADYTTMSSQLTSAVSTQTFDTYLASYGQKYDAPGLIGATAAAPPVVTLPVVVTSTSSAGDGKPTLSTGGSVGVAVGGFALLSLVAVAVYLHVTPRGSEAGTTATTEGGTTAKERRPSLQEVIPMRSSSSSSSAPEEIEGESGTAVDFGGGEKDDEENAQKSNQISHAESVSSSADAAVDNDDHNKRVVASHAHFEINV